MRNGRQYRSLSNEKGSGLKTIIGLLGVTWCVVLFSLTPAQAGCGCDKPPPQPAAILQSAAFAGMPVTFLHPGFQAGQEWTVEFQSGTTTAAVTAPVVLRRDLTSPTVPTLRLQLIVVVPELPVGPTSISLSTQADAFVVPEDTFTVIAKPVMISEQIADYDIHDYTTAVSAEGILYLSVGGLEQVCQAMEFKIRVDGSPLRFDQIAIFNAQGFLIDELGPATADIFLVEPEDEDDESDRVRYFRHSFAEYCASHQPGAAKEVDQLDPNWHLDGTPHVDYSTLIFAVTSHLDDGSGLDMGSVSYETLNIETNVGEGIEPWETEQEEEGVAESD